jgi:hypothetical protein
MTPRMPKKRSGTTGRFLSASVSELMATRTGEENLTAANTTSDSMMRASHKSPVTTIILMKQMPMEMPILMEGVLATRWCRQQEILLKEHSFKCVGGWLSSCIMPPVTKMTAQGGRSNKMTRADGRLRRGCTLHCSRRGGGGEQ